MLTGRHVLLGVTGSIAAYKAVGLLRRLIERGAQVTVVMSESAQRFVGPLTFQTLSGRPVYHDLFDPRDEILHLTLADAAHVFLIAPATANTISRLAAGAASDLMSSLALAARCPVMLAPAMDAVMWEHPLVQRNLATLRGMGITVIAPEHGPLASGLVGMGRFPPEDAIVAAVEGRLGAGSWATERVIVTAGPTAEAIDPVRVLTNRSSGKMGYAVAEAARARGAAVTLITGPTALPAPGGMEVVQVETADEMRRAVLARIDKATLLVMAAAVADYRPGAPAATKRKKTPASWSLELVPTEDILAEVATRHPHPDRVVVGFAAETESLVERATAKLRAKALDLIVANDVGVSGIGFGSDMNEVTLIDRGGTVTTVPRLPKRLIAERILDRVDALRHPASAPPSG